MIIQVYILQVFLRQAFRKAGKTAEEEEAMIPGADSKAVLVIVLLACAAMLTIGVLFGGLPLPWDLPGS